LNQLKEGLVQSVTGIVIGLVLTAMIDALVKNGVIPSYVVPLFGVASIIGNIFTISSMRLRRFGTLYAVGWLIGSLIFKDLLSPVDYLLNIVASISILVIRIALWSKEHTPTYTKRV
jgi:hypothetical protein